MNGSALYPDVVTSAERAILDALTVLQGQIDQAASVDRALQLNERLQALGYHVELTQRSARAKADALCGSQCYVTAEDYATHWLPAPLRIVGRNA